MLQLQLHAAGIDLVRVKPLLAAFARSTGRLAKTEAIDACLLAAMAHAYCNVPIAYTSRSDIALHEPSAGRRLVLAAGHRNGRAAQRLVVSQQPDALDFNLALDQFLEAIDETLDVSGFHVLVQCRLG